MANLFINIESQFTKKLEMLSFHKSQRAKDYMGTDYLELYNRCWYSRLHGYSYVADLPSIEQWSVQMSSTNILVTGGCGFIGYHLCLKLEEAGYNLTVVDNFLTGSNYNKIKSPRIKYVSGNINDPLVISTLFSNTSCKYVFHFAAVVGVELTLARATYWC